MWTLPDSSKLSAGAARMALAVLLALGLLLAGGALPAQPAPRGDLGDPDSQALRTTIEKRYEVLPIRGGVLLQPRKPRAGVRSIEVSGSSVAVNGEPVVPTVLRDWLGNEEAGPILRLRDLAPEQRRALFGLGAEAAVAPDRDPEADVEVDADAADDADDDAEAVEEVVTDAPEMPEPPDPDVIVPAPPGTPDAPAGVADVEDDEAGVTHSGAQVRFGSGVTVEKGEVADEVIAFGGSVRMDGEVERDVAAIGGSVEINGRVGGNVAAIGGTVHLGPNAEIQGDLSAVGGDIEREPGSKVYGSISEVPAFLPGVGGNWDWDGGVDSWVWSPFGASLELFGSLMSILVLALLVALTILIARRPLEEADAQLVAEPWKCALTGFAAVLFSLPLLLVVTVLLALTIVGCVLFLLYPFLGLFAILVLILGYAVVAHRVGRWIEHRFGWTPGSTYRAAFIGILALEVWTVLGRLLAMGNGVLDVFAGVVLLFDFIVWFAAWTIGLGAVLLAWSANRPQRWRTVNAGGVGGVPPGTLPPPPAPVPYTDPYGTPPAPVPPVPPPATPPPPAVP